MKKPNIDKLQEQRRREMQLGHIRLCPACHRQVTTVRGKFVTHGPAANGDFTCPNSGRLVDAPAPSIPQPSDPI